MKRRSLLQVLCASGTGIATMGAVSAESENVVDFVNLQLVASPNELVPDSVVTGSMPSVVGHYVDPQRETIHLNKFMSDEDSIPAEHNVGIVLPGTFDLNSTPMCATYPDRCSQGASKCIEDSTTAGWDSQFSARTVDAVELSYQHANGNH